MATLVYAYVIYNGTQGTYVGDGTTITINCERLQSYSPRPVWLVRELAPGDGTIVLYVPTFYPSSDQILDPNTLTGLWVEVDGQDVMIDVLNQDPTLFNTACNACCGSVPTIITPEYGLAVPAFAPLTLNTLCIFSTDDGSAKAHDNFAARYVGLYIGYARMRSNFSLVSHYQITTYYTLAQFQTMLLSGDTAFAGACES
jgi:hypothetical protein